jgi:hypothetical protein
MRKDSPEKEADKLTVKSFPNITEHPMGPSRASRSHIFFNFYQLVITTFELIYNDVSAQKNAIPHAFELHEKVEPMGVSYGADKFNQGIST